MSESSCEFPRFQAADEEIGAILRATKTIAVVGLSPKPERPSHGIARFLMERGYDVIPVNPGHKEILGRTCYPSLAAVPGPIDMVNIFRPPEAVPPIVDEAIQKQAKAVWMQEGIVNNAAAERARSAGLTVVMNKCILKEIRARD